MHEEKINSKQIGMEECKCDYCSSNRAKSRTFGFSDRTHYFWACDECFRDYLNDFCD